MGEPARDIQQISVCCCSSNYYPDSILCIYPYQKTKQIDPDFLMKKSSNSYLFALLIIILFGFLAVSDNFLPKQTPDLSPVGIPITVTGTRKAQSSLQFNNLPFISATPTLPGQASSGACASPQGDLSSLTADIKNKYGLILSGNALTVPRAQAVYDSMCLAFESTKFIKNLNSLQHPVNVEFRNTGRCYAQSGPNPPSILMEEPCDTTLIDKYIIIHELVHIMQFGSSLGRDAHWNAWQTVWSKESSHRIPTGPCVIEETGDGGECEADAVAEYMYYKTYRNSWGGVPAGSYTFSNYKTDYPLWYNFAKDNIFGGLEY